MLGKSLASAVVLLALSSIAQADSGSSVFQTMPVSIKILTSVATEKVAQAPSVQKNLKQQCVAALTPRKGGPVQSAMGTPFLEIKEFDPNTMETPPTAPEITCAKADSMVVCSATCSVQIDEVQ